MKKQTDFLMQTVRELSLRIIFHARRTPPHHRLFRDKGVGETRAIDS